MSNTVEKIKSLNEQNEVVESENLSTTDILEKVSSPEYITVGSEAIVPLIEEEPIPEEKPFRKVEPKKGFKYGCYCAVKRFFDFILSLIALIVLSPFILITLLVKWIEDGKNPIYVQKRVGKNGKLFRFYKIRTMCVGAERMKDELISKGTNEMDGPMFKMEKDPRITKVGRFYRRWSIDEILQLINILNGTMSIVGPRPPLPREVEKFTEEQKQKLAVRGGLLCLWQIQKNRNKIKFEDWISLDLDYIEKQSLWLDIKIIFKGAYMVLFDRTGE